eukprot:TRINITY_DN9892_c0_g1_i2.p1 TRINITY_DN9892_c0_g1~~TRINITY_DN9892_c0_g1_i2.p1  ORF type:complete len:123 (+),score=29.56 TRINITY_DN9892_c0_g1_i2:57-371(+)
MSVVSAVAKRLVPLFDRVLIQRAAAETKTKGGLLIPEKAQSKNNEGVVVAVGPGARTESGDTVPMCVTVGDKVLLPEFGGAKIEMDGEEFQMFRETDLVARINN